MMAINILIIMHGWLLLIISAIMKVGVTTTTKKRQYA